MLGASQIKPHLWYRLRDEAILNDSTKKIGRPREKGPAMDEDRGYLTFSIRVIGVARNLSGPINRTSATKSAERR